MEKKQTKVEVKVAPEVQEVMNHLTAAYNGLKEAYAASKKVKDCPNKVTDRIKALWMTHSKSQDAIESRLMNLEAKAVKVEAAAVRKTAHLEKMKVQATKLAARIAAAEKK